MTRITNKLSLGTLFSVTDGNHQLALDLRGNYIWVNKNALVQEGLNIKVDLDYVDEMKEIYQFISTLRDKSKGTICPVQISNKFMELLNKYFDKKEKYNYEYNDIEH